MKYTMILALSLMSLISVHAMDRQGRPDEELGLLRHQLPQPLEIQMRHISQYADMSQKDTLQQSSEIGCMRGVEWASTFFGLVCCPIMIPLAMWCNPR